MTSGNRWGKKPTTCLVQSLDNTELMHSIYSAEGHISIIIYLVNMHFQNKKLHHKIDKISTRRSTESGMCYPSTCIT